MHNRQTSVESTPQTVKSSNLSSLPEATPAIHRARDRFVDMDDAELAAHHLPDCASVEERTPDPNSPIPATNDDSTSDSRIPKNAHHITGQKLAMDEEKEGSEVEAAPMQDQPAETHHSPRHSRNYSDDDAATLIQRNWVNQNYKRKSAKVEIEREKDNLSVISYKTLVKIDEEAQDINLPEDDQLLYAHLTRASYVFESPMEKFLQSPSEDVHISPSNEDLDLKEPWIAPSIEFAKITASHLHPRHVTQDKSQYNIVKTSTGRHCVYKGWGEQCDLFHEGSFSSFGQFGAGITNYFKFIKFCFWIFVTLSVLYTPNLIFSVNGNGGLSEFGSTTLGNVAPYNNTEYTYIPECSRDGAWTCKVEMENVGLMWETMDIVGCIIVLVGFVWLRFFEKAEAAHLNRFHVTPSDYTVLVSNLPPSCTEADLRVYFARLMNEAVTEIVFIYDDEDDIAISKRRGDLVKRRYHLTQQYRYHHSFVNKEKNKPPHQAMQKTIPADSGTKDFLDGKLTRKGLLIHLSQSRTEVTNSIKALDRRIKRASQKEVDKPLNQAYVTFHAHAAKHMAIKKHKVTLWRVLKPDPGTLLKGHRLHVTGAPDPEKIIWENVKYSRPQRLTRQFISFCFGLVLVFVCIVMVSITLGYDTVVLDEGGREICPESFDSWSPRAQRSYVRSHSETLHCYCEAAADGGANTDGCKRYFETITIARLFRVATALCCVASAVLVDALFFMVQGFEKHISTDGREKSIMWRSLILKFLIYGIVFLFTVGHFDGEFQYQSPSIGFNFTRLWYDSTGQGLVLTMLLSVLSPHIFKLYQYIKYILRQKSAEAHRIVIFTQDEMNSRFMGPEFVLSHRYSQLVASFLVLYMYSTSFPIFAFIGVANFYMTYWLDKFLFVRYYQSPIRYPSSVGLQASALVPYAVVAHLILALWAVSQSEVFETAHSETAFGTVVYSALGLKGIDPGGLKKLISQRHTVFLAILLLVLIIVLIAKWIVHHFLFAGSRISQLLCFDFVSKYDFFFSTKLFNKKRLSMSFPRAVRRGYIRGLDSYNILQNKRYKDAFQIEEHEAMQHRRVRSMLASADQSQKRSGAPKQLPEHEAMEARAMMMFNMYSNSSPDNIPRDVVNPATSRSRPDGRGHPTPLTGSSANNKPGHKRIKHAQSYDDAAMEYGENKNMPFHVVKGAKESRLVSDSYNVRIRQDVKDEPTAMAMGAKKHSKKRSENISDLSSSLDASDTDETGRSPEKPVVYATLSKKLLDARMESEDVVQARVLRRFESENEYEPKRNYKSKSQKFSRKNKPGLDGDFASPMPSPLTVPRGVDTGPPVSGLTVVRPERTLMREASEELISATRTAGQPKRKGPGLLGDRNGSFISSSPKDATPRSMQDASLPSSGLSNNATPRVVSSKNTVSSGDPDDKFKKSGVEWIADTPRAVIGTPRSGMAAATPREGDASDMGTPRERQIEMPPPDKIMRGKKKHKPTEDPKDIKVSDTDIPTLHAVTATGQVVSSVEKSPDHSARNAQRVLGMSNPSVDILKPKNSISSRRKSQAGAAEEDEIRVREHRRERSDISDPAKKFIPKSMNSFGDKSAASLANRRDARQDTLSDDDSMRSLSPVHLTPDKVLQSLGASQQEKQPLGHIRKRLEEEVPSSASMDGSDDDNVRTPRIRVVNGASNIVSQSAPNSTDPKKESFQRNIDDGVTSRRGSKW